MSDISSVLPEPPNGTCVMLTERWGRERRLIWRDDAEAEQCESSDGERWFDGDTTSDPLDWPEATKCAFEATIVPSTPTAKVTP